MLNIQKVYYYNDNHIQNLNENGFSRQIKKKMQKKLGNFKYTHHFLYVSGHVVIILKWVIMEPPNFFSFFFGTK
mgnify:CR=1 FL=1